MEKIVTDNAQKISAVSADVKGINLKTQDNHSKIAQLEKQVENQSVAIENLTKAKNTMFNKISSLELKLDMSSN